MLNRRAGTELADKLQKDQSCLTMRRRSYWQRCSSRRDQALEKDDVEDHWLRWRFWGPGSCLTKWQLKEKELREQK